MTIEPKAPCMECANIGENWICLKVRMDIRSGFRIANFKLSDWFLSKWDKQRDQALVV